MVVPKNILPPDTWVGPKSPWDWDVVFGLVLLTVLFNPPTKLVAQKIALSTPQNVGWIPGTFGISSSLFLPEKAKLWTVSLLQRLSSVYKTCGIWVFGFLLLHLADNQLHHLNFMCFTHLSRVFLPFVPPLCSLEMSPHIGNHHNAGEHLWWITTHLSLDLRKMQCVVCRCCFFLDFLRASN